MIQIACRCGTPYTLGDHLAGRSFRCTRCQAILTIPAAPAAPPPAASPVPAPPPVYAPPPPSYAPPGAPPYAPPPSGEARWGASGTLGALPPEPAPPPARKPRPSKSQPVPLPDDDDDAVRPPPPSSEVAPFPEKLELSDEVPRKKRDKGDRLESSLEWSSNEKDAVDGLENSVERSSERPKKKPRPGTSGERAALRSSGSSPARRGVKRGPEESAEGSREVLRSSAENRFAMDCPVCEATIARSATTCPSCGVPLGGRAGLTPGQKKLLQGLAKGAAVVLVLAVGVFAWKSLREDAGGGHGRSHVAHASPSPAPAGSPGPRVSPIATPLPGPSPAPSLAPTPAPSPSPAPAASPSPAPTPAGASAPARRSQVPPGPFEADLEALRDAPDLPAAESAIEALAAKPDVAAAAIACEKDAAPSFRARLARLLLASPDADTRRAAADRAFRSTDLEVVLAGLEWAAGNESADAVRTRLVNLQARELGVVLEGALNVLQGATEPPSGVAVDQARAAAEQGSRELGARLAALLLAGGDGSQLAAAPDALVARSTALRKATLRGLEAFAHRKGARDPVADGAGARAEWSSWASAYAPIRSLLAKACADVTGDKVPAEALARAVDARVDLLARKRDVVPFLPQFAGEAVVHTPAGGAALGLLIERLATPGDKDVLVQVVDSLGEDARGGAPAIAGACLRVGDRDVAAAVARAIDRGAISFRDAATFLPDLLEPSPAPRTALEAIEPEALVVVGLFRDGKGLERAFDLPRRIAVDEAFARAGSREIEKRLVAIGTGKDKATTRVDESEARRLLAEVGTRSLVSDLMASLNATLEPRANELGPIVDRCAGSEQALALVKLAEKWKDKDPIGANQWLRVAAHAARGTDVRDAVGKAIGAHVPKTPAPAATPKSGKGTPAPAPSPTGSSDALRGQAADALADLQGEWLHDEVARRLEQYLKDDARQGLPPQLLDLVKFAASSSLATAKKDVKLVLLIADQAAGVRAQSEQASVASWVYRMLVKLRASGDAIAPLRDRAGEPATVKDPLRPEVAALLGACHDASSIGILRDGLASLDDPAAPPAGTREAGYLAGLAATSPADAAPIAVKLLASGSPTNQDLLEACLFAVARGGSIQDAHLLGDRARSPDPNLRAAVARAIGLAARAGGANQGPALLERLSLDPHPLVRLEAALAGLAVGKDAQALWDAALAFELGSDLMGQKPRASLAALAAGAVDEEPSSFLELARAFDRATHGAAKLDVRPDLPPGRVREVIRSARAFARHGS